MNWIVMGGVALAALVVGKAAAAPFKSVKPGSQTKHKALYAQFGGFEGYILHLHTTWAAHRDELARDWPVERIKQAVINAATSAGVKPEQVWGLVWHESTGQPKGIYGSKMNMEIPSKDDEAAYAAALKQQVQPAVNANSTAYGIGQVVVSSFDDVAAYLPFNHYDLWHPDCGALATAFLWKRKLQYAKGDLATACDLYGGNHWNGVSVLAYIQEYGGNVRAA